MCGALAKVAVHTALTHTSFQPRMLVMRLNYTCHETMPGQHVLPRGWMCRHPTQRRFHKNAALGLIASMSFTWAGLRIKLVTWEESGCRNGMVGINPRTFLARDQSNWLVRCNHLEQWEQADKKARANWSKGADSPFQ